MFSIKYLVDIMWQTTAHIICIFAKFGEYAKCAPDGSPSDFSPLAQTHSVRVHYFCHEPTIIYGVDTCGRLKNLQKTYFRYHDQLICILLKYIYKHTSLVIRRTCMACLNAIQGRSQRWGRGGSRPPSPTKDSCFPHELLLDYNLRTV